jgi:hypothetical protein
MYWTLNRIYELVFFADQMPLSSKIYDNLRPEWDGGPGSARLLCGASYISWMSVNSCTFTDAVMIRYTLVKHHDLMALQG